MSKISNDVFHRIPENAFRKLISGSTSIRQVFIKMGLCISGDQYKPFRKRVEELDIDLSHFKGYYVPKERFRTETPIEKVFVKDSYWNGTALSQKIRKYNLKEPKCAKCGLGDIWNGESITLQVDHENGDNTDNRLENLRFLCPNCHSQTKTFAGRRHKKHRHCVDCGKSCHHKHIRCLACNNRLPRINKWPKNEEISKRIWELPLARLAQEWGGSANGLKRHCQKNNISYPPQGYWMRRRHGYSHEESFIKQTRDRSPQRRLSDSDIQKAHEMIEKHIPVRTVAESLGFAHTTLARGLKRLGLWRSHRENAGRKLVDIVESPVA